MCIRDRYQRRVQDCWMRRAAALLLCRRGAPLLSRRSSCRFFASVQGASMNVGHTSISVHHGDILEEDTIGIINPTNGMLINGFNVSGAILQAAGPTFQEECSKYVEENGSLKEGDVAVTSAGKADFQAVIHAVGPYYVDGKRKEKEKLKSVVSKSLQEAADRNLKSIAIPAISCGYYGYPKEEGAQVILQAITDFCKSNKSLSDIRLVEKDSATFEIFSKTLQSLK
eukprot:TRINITY_DN620_c0_g1_i2.p1 TRINITY_DN620_c0_g1~~TRINITY_DN620_c0_g1_i2.p1  ORF type:complete len:227 (-),score=39.10 TRINITY_DN620_c0_g1_i2:7-687(-)